jgi:hypothetical protein
MTYGNMHADYSEFLADTSSFANTSGGDLVRGPREELTEEERYRVADDVMHRLKQRGDPWRLSGRCHCKSGH